MDAASLYWVPWALASIGIAISIYVYFFKPNLRHRKLKQPIEAHFTIRDSRRSISGREVSKGDPHHVRQLTLRSNRTIDIEVGLYPKIPISVDEIVLSCGDSKDAPLIKKRISQYVKTGARPSTKDDYQSNGAYHARVDRKFNVGTHYVMGFRLRTRGAGRYPVSLALLTDEIEGNYEGLEILVEDTPSTQMLCHAKEHGRNCLVSAVPLKNTALIAKNKKFPAAHDRPPRTAARARRSPR
jgi:hypothetical protein